MDIGAPVRELDVVKSARLLAGAVLQLPEDAWLCDQSRQNTFEVHNQTRSLVLLFNDGEWPDIQVEKKSAWESLAETAVPVMQEILNKHFDRGGVILSAMAARMLPHSTIEGHTDNHPMFSCAHRIHVPLLTNRDVIFLVGGKQITMDVGKGYEINNQLLHRVHNGGDENRIHFIFDYVPPSHVECMPDV
jgi:aspartyl/asparaginyl beta-hydroxylase